MPICSVLQRDTRAFGFSLSDIFRWDLFAAIGIVVDDAIVVVEAVGDGRGAFALREATKESHGQLGKRHYRHVGCFMRRIRSGKKSFLSGHHGTTLPAAVYHR